MREWITSRFSAVGYNGEVGEKVARSKLLSPDIFSWRERNGNTSTHDVDCRETGRYGATLDVDARTAGAIAAGVARRTAG